MHTAQRWKSAGVSRHAPVWIGMAAIAAVSWYYLFQMEQGMSAMVGSEMTQGHMAGRGMESSQFGATFAMWAVMMLAMMLPAIVPSALLFSNLAAKRNPGSSRRATAMYVAGYAGCWVLFAVPAAALQSTLTASSWLDSMAQSTSAWMSAAILLAAGLYQVSALKTACLAKCRSPLGFFMAKWRDGSGGALLLGIQHGGYCVGCCWAMMAVMFVVGAMNLVWMGVITMLILGEKLVPTAWRFDRITGLVLVLAALWIGAVG